MKRYLYIHWKKPGPGEPSHTYSELDDSRHEIRKVELYANGTRGFADANEDAGGTSWARCPSRPWPSWPAILPSRRRRSRPRSSRDSG